MSEKTTTSLLDRVQKGPSNQPPRILIHGQQGIGKTTFASRIPGVLVLSVEDGTGDLSFPRLQFATWPDLRAAVKELVAKGCGPYGAIAIDTISTAEAMVHRHICQGAKALSIEDVGGGFGKGYTAATEEMSDFAGDLDVLRLRHRVAVIVLAHSSVQSFNDPTGISYDQYQLRLHKSARQLWLGWSDITAFAGLKAVVATQRKNARVTDKGKAVSAKRVLCLESSAAYDAKNRYNLPSELPLDFAVFARAFDWSGRVAGWAGREGPDWEKLKPEIAGALAKLDPPVALEDLSLWHLEVHGRRMESLNRRQLQDLYRQLKADSSGFVAWLNAPEATEPEPEPVAEDEEGASEDDAGDFEAGA